MTKKIAIITGGAKGLGKSISQKFLENNYKVFVLSRTKPASFEEELKGAVFIQCDCRNRNEVSEAIRQVVDQAYHIDVLVNNVGLSQWKSLEKVDEDFLEFMIETNLYSTFWGCQAVQPFMSEGCSIINVASLAGKRGSKNNSVYNMAKFGVVGLTQALAKELGEKGIRVNGICPVYVPTDGLISQLKDDHPEVGDQDPVEFINSWGKKNAALQRLPSAEECANLCLFLASDLASAITGQNINVDCGVLPQ